jgi:hypothetical protein
LKPRRIVLEVDGHKSVVPEGMDFLQAVPTVGGTFTDDGMSIAGR